MIISHKYKFILIKTKKTAGTSIEISLSRYCGDRDIITPIAPKDEIVRTQLGKYPQNYSDNETLIKLCKASNKIIHKTTGQQLESIRRLMLNQFRYYKHMPAQKIKKEVGDEIWNSYFKFCFERNPWDRVISYYYYRKGTKKRYNYDYSLQDFFDELAKNQKMESEISEFQRYQVNNVVAVDFIGRYEKLRDDLTLVCTQLGIPFDGWLPNAKGGFRTDRKSYKEILNDEHKERVQRLCPEVIHLMGYSFEHPEQAKPYQRQQLDEA